MPWTLGRLPYLSPSAKWMMEKNQIWLSDLINDDNYDDKCGRHFMEHELAHVPRKGNPVRVHFNGHVQWVSHGTDTGNRPKHDIFTVALHEIGHAIGLNHSGIPGTVMFETHSQSFKELTPDNIAGAQYLYGEKTTSAVVPTTSIVVPSTYITPSVTHRDYCKPGQYYCGWQLQNMGYRLVRFFNGSFNNPEEHLFRCDRERRGVYYTKCYQSCISNGELDSTCMCNHTERVCGHALRRKYNIIPTDYNARYECRSNTLQHFNTCTDRCAYNSCKDTILRCNASRLYCGVEMLESGFFRAPPPHWDFNAIYNCMDPNTPVVRCPGLCVNSSCLTHIVTK